MSPRTLTVSAILLIAASSQAIAVPIAHTTHGPESTSLNGSIVAGDLIAGQIATTLAGDQGWHSANTDPADQLPAFTDGAGIRPTGLTGLLNDFPAAGAPVKRIQYEFASPKDVGRIQILTGNNGKDGRVFSTVAISTSNNGGGSFLPLGYFQSDASGTVNTGQWGSTLLAIADSEGGALRSGVTHLAIDLYAVDNTGGQMRDPFDGVNPFTTADDGLSAAFVSPLVFEIDVQVPEPATAALGGTALAALAALRRARRWPR
jgi:hypothetical protein